MLSNYIADMMIKPGSSPVFGDPSEYGLEYEDVTFKAEDGVELSGWLIKGGSDKVIIQSHFGVQCSRAGYTPKGKGMIKFSKTDVDFLRQAQYLVSQGYSVLMYDFRNHGDSGKGNVPWVSWGPEEAKDVVAAVEFISTHPVYKEVSIGLFSICMGSSASVYAYGAQKLQQYQNIKAMVAVQPLTFTEFTKAMGIPGFLIKGANKEMQKRTGINFLTKTFMPDVCKVTVPTMVIQNSNDPWTNMDLVNEYYAKLDVEKEMFWVDLEKNRGAAYKWIGTEPDKWAAWFERYM